MIYRFSFKEINYGSIDIVSSHEPDRGEVIEKIMEGCAFYKDTEYDYIKLEAKENDKP
ncbi:MAG: hypothetical protein FWG69_03745 [Oscillospiraceae bacterium]|nr:hypothetical protein [Oscillospiraceae bacterium]